MAATFRDSKELARFIHMVASGKGTVTRAGRSGRTPHSRCIRPVRSRSASTRAMMLDPPISSVRCRPLQCDCHGTRRTSPAASTPRPGWSGSRRCGVRPSAIRCRSTLDGSSRRRRRTLRGDELFQPRRRTYRSRSKERSRSARSGTSTPGSLGPARRGSVDIRKMLTYANTWGCSPRRSGRQVARNFPQAFTHLSLINASIG